MTDNVRGIRIDPEKALWAAVHHTRQRSQHELPDKEAWDCLLQRLKVVPEDDEGVTEMLRSLYALKRQYDDAARYAGRVYEELDRARRNSVDASLEHWRTQEESAMDE